jgi:hypothetical protein
MDKTVIVKSAKESGKFGAGTAGLLAGGLLVSKLPTLDALKKIPGVGEILSQLAPGMLLMFGAFIANMKTDNDYIKNGLYGVGMAGVLDILRRTGLLAKINNAADTGLKGLGIVQNFGAYSPDYFMKSNWAERPLNGLGAADTKAFTLQGNDANSFGLQGSKEKSFALQGTVGCMYQ